MSILTEAEALINGARQEQYNHPFDNFSQTAELWSPILGVDVTPEQVALCMIQVKISRLCHSPTHRDSQVDIAGYAGTYEKVLQRRESMRYVAVTIAEEIAKVATPPAAITPHFSDVAQPGQVVKIEPLIAPAVEAPNQIEEPE